MLSLDTGHPVFGLGIRLDGLKLVGHQSLLPRMFWIEFPSQFYCQEIKESMMSNTTHTSIN